MSFFVFYDERDSKPRPSFAREKGSSAAFLAAGFCEQAPVRRVKRKHAWPM